MGVYFFATTREDLLPVLEVVEAQFEIKYVSGKWFVTPDIPIFYSALEIPNLGRCDKWGATCSSYYIIPCPQKILAEYMPNRTVPEKYTFERKIPGGSDVGGPTYVLDGLLYHEGNAVGVDFHFGGLYSGEGGPALLQGVFHKLSDTPETLALFNAYKKEIRNRWACIRESAVSLYIGPEAERLLGQGMRLAPSIQSPRGADVSPTAERIRAKTRKASAAAAKPKKKTMPKTRLNYEDSCRRLQPSY